MAVAHRQNGWIDGARSALKKAALLSKKEISVCTLDYCIELERANLAFLSGNLVEAKTIWDALVKNRDYYSKIASVAYYSLAVVALEEGDMDAASIYCKEGLLLKIVDLVDRFETLASQIAELKVAPATVVIRKSNAPIITVFPIQSYQQKTIIQPKVYNVKGSSSWDAVVDLGF